MRNSDIILDYNFWKKLDLVLLKWMKMLQYIWVGRLLFISCMWLAASVPLVFQVRKETWTICSFSCPIVALFQLLPLADSSPHLPFQPPFTNETFLYFMHFFPLENTSKSDVGAPNPVLTTILAPPTENPEILDPPRFPYNNYLTIKLLSNWLSR